MGGVKKRLLLGLFLALLMLPTVLSDCTAYSSEIFCSDIRGSCFEFQCGGGLNWHLLSVKDTTINSDNPDQNRSSSLYMDIGSTLNSIRYSLIKFNLSSIQQGAIVESAILHVNVFEAASGEILDVFIYQINESWPENATWNTAPTTTQNPLYQTTINLSMAPYWAEIDIKNMTISWIEKGQPNYGMLLKSNITGVNKYARLSTREHGSFQPLLIINYKTPALIASEADKEIIEQPPEKVPKRGGGGGGDIAVDEESIVEEIVEGEKFFSEL
ncbi:DNRLRE domain-containing protein, partial [Candidatus Woesearchaeota archaeon]|nr:DNRLRE domain-containing protein [Candidatus Woesearchaeota archaeon]